MTDPSQSGESYSAMDELRRGLAHVAESTEAEHRLNVSAILVDGARSADGEASATTDPPNPHLSTRVPNAAALARVDALMSQFASDGRVPSSRSQTNESVQIEAPMAEQGLVQHAGPLDQVGTGDGEQTISTWVEELPSAAVQPVVVFSTGVRLSLSVGETVVVGRGSGEGRVVVDHKELSRSHFSLTGADEAVTIIDLGSTNGTEVALGDKIASLVPKATYSITRGTRVLVGDNLICEIT